MTRQGIESASSTTPTVEDVKQALHAAWDPLPVPPAKELFNSRALEVGDWETLDGYKIFAGKRWDEVDRSKLWHESWMTNLESHLGYYYASWLLALAEMEQPEALVAHCSAGFLPLLRPTLKAKMGRLTPAQKEATITALDRVYALFPESELQWHKRGFFTGYRRLKRWQAKRWSSVD